MGDKPPASVFMTADTVGGVWTYAMELARCLAARGTVVTLATMGQPLAPSQWQEAQAVPALQVVESTFRLEWMDEPWTDVDRASEWLLELSAHVRPEIVHVNGFSQAALPWGAPVLCVAHSCVLSWWRAVKCEAAPAGYDEYRRRVTRGLHSADVVAAPSQAMLTSLEEYVERASACSGIQPANWCVLPNARSSHSFHSADKQPFILTSGRLWDEAKNVAAVDAVAPALPWPVYVAGDQQHPNGSDAHLKAAHALGRLSAADLAGWFSRASIYVLPARYEPFGLSALEAALSGCALVLGDIASLREVWGDAALYVPPDDRRALQETLERVIRSDSLRADLAARARLRARRFTPERMTAAYVDAYEQARRNFESRRKAAA